MSSVHHSPMISSDCAIEQFMSAKDALRMATTVAELHDATQAVILSFMTQLSERRDRLRPHNGPRTRLRISPGEFAVELDTGWSSLVGIHGGYMSALTVERGRSRGRERTAPCAP